MKLSTILQDINQCKYCKDHLPFAPKPILTATSNAKLLIVGQAPGIRVHKSGIPWDDASGERLRNWLNIDRATFYSDEKIAIVPMAFCYPGKGKSGDLPPRPECSSLWRPKLHKALPKIRLTLLIGLYAQRYYLNQAKNITVTETVSEFAKYLRLGYMPLIHPSPRNQPWMKKNPWFEQEAIPVLQKLVAEILSNKQYL